MDTTATGATSGPSVTDEARAKIGHETLVHTFEPVALRTIKEYVAGTDEWNPLHVDEDYARASRHGAIVAPALFFLAACRLVVPEHVLLEDGEHADLGVEGVSGNALIGGQEMELFTPVKVGDVLTVREVLAGIEEKVGRSGALVVVTTDERYTNQRDELVATCTTTRIFR